jgi:hypothetical protein
MKNLFAAILVLTMLAFSGCNVQGLDGAYHASVAFTGKDPRYVGQKYDWNLLLKPDATFVFTFELPMAIHTEDGHEVVGVASAQVAGAWQTTGKKVLLTRRSGEGLLGSTDTMSFSFHDNQITLTLSKNGVQLQEDGRVLELRKLPNKPDAGDGKQPRLIRIVGWA